MGMKTSGGEIIPVQGGHILRSTGRKDRHSKVYTSKGLRDRRVRLAAHTAIQFYDVQDRLGYDRPSKAVDWLIKKAKSAIDKLTELPPWHPVPSTFPTSDLAVPLETESFRFDSQGQLENSSTNNNNNSNNNSNTLTSFIPPQIESDPMIDSMKSFFPTRSTNSTADFSTFPPGILSRTMEQRQDLGLSLHTFQDPRLIHEGVNSSNNSNITSNNEELYRSPLGFEANYQKIMSWSNREQLAVAEQQGIVSHGIGSGSGLGLGFLRGTLQSSFAYDDTMAMSMPLQGFRIPARIQGTVEEGHQHQFVSERPSCSTSPNSGH